MSLNKLATFVSELLGPLFWAPAVVVAFLFKSNLSGSNLKILFLLVFILQVVIPLAYIYYFSLKLHLASAWDEPKRQERYPLLALLLGCFLLSSIAIYRLGTPLLFNLELITLILLIIILIVTIYWKISFHISLATFGSLMINFLYGFKLPYLLLFLSIPILYWARLTLRRHTKGQLLAAFLINLIITLGGLYLVGYT